MPAVVIVGAQWGDEGKGKVVDLYAEAADMVVRYAGGPNAGHTLVVGDGDHRRPAHPERHPPAEDPLRDGAGDGGRPGRARRRDRRARGARPHHRRPPLRLGPGARDPALPPARSTACARAPPARGRRSARPSAASAPATRTRPRAAACAWATSPTLRRPRRSSSARSRAWAPVIRDLGGEVARRGAHPRRSRAARRRASARSSPTPRRSSRARSPRPASASCSRARRARCSTSTTGPTRS